MKPEDYKCIDIYTYIFIYIYVYEYIWEEKKTFSIRTWPTFYAKKEKAVINRGSVVSSQISTIFNLCCEKQALTWFVFKMWPHLLYHRVFLSAVMLAVTSLIFCCHSYFNFFFFFFLKWRRGARFLSMFWSWSSVALPAGVRMRLNVRAERSLVRWDFLLRCVLQVWTKGSARTHGADVNFPVWFCHSKTDQKQAI